MNGDFSRSTFDPSKHFLRVLMQQGRAQLDADFNEQAALLVHYLQALAADLIGPHGGLDDGFKIVTDDNDSNALKDDFLIFPGHYYVNGVLCENNLRHDLYGTPLPVKYTQQPDYPLPDCESLAEDKTYLVYLDAWERHISFLQDDSIRESALAGPDTATRARIVWQVKVFELTDEDTCDAAWGAFEQECAVANRGMLKARAKVTKTATDPCITPPQARYRGVENQLYRVEIHNSGKAFDGKGPAKVNEATFKWSRDNGSIAYAIRALEGRIATLEHLGRDKRLGLKIGDWVEIIDDHHVLRGEPGLMAQVDDINPVEMEVTLRLPDTGDKEPPPYPENSNRHPLLRRWDHQAGKPTLGEAELADDGALLVEEGTWIQLEDGVSIYFKPNQPLQPLEQKVQEKKEAEHHYRTGDYWLIPARTATGDVEWPGPPDDPEALPPDGVRHHYAPLALISLDGNGYVSLFGDEDCRCTFTKLCSERGVRER